MTPRSFFIITLRVLAIFLLANLLVGISDILASTWSMFEFGTSRALLLFFFSLIKAVVILATGYWLLFKTEKIIDSFGLDRGFKESHLQFTLSMTSTLQIALIVAGAILLLLEIPRLFENVHVLWVQYSIVYFERGEISWSPITISLVRIILALLIIGERKRICQFLVKEQANEPLKQGTDSDLPS